MLRSRDGADAIDGDFVGVTQSGGIMALSAKQRTNREPCRQAGVVTEVVPPVLAAVVILRIGHTPDAYGLGYEVSQPRRLTGNTGRIGSRLKNILDTTELNDFAGVICIPMRPQAHWWDKQSSALAEIRAYLFRCKTRQFIYGIKALLWAICVDNFALASTRSQRG